MSMCARCGIEFHCAVADGGDAPCWCMTAPAGLPLPDSAGATCWCPACLKERIAANLVKTDNDRAHD
ncbi:MAG: cysteine-rich CWC family protein [Massilia sp.]